MIQTKSAYEPKSPADGYRVLIEPDWPKGLPQGKQAGVDWMKSLFPSRNLQDWMRRNPRKAPSFRDSYLLELAKKDAEIEKLSHMLQERGTITILTVERGGPFDIYETLASFLRATVD